MPRGSESAASVSTKNKKKYLPISVGPKVISFDFSVSDLWLRDHEQRELLLFHPDRGHQRPHHTLRLHRLQVQQQRLQTQAGLRGKSLFFGIWLFHRIKKCFTKKIFFCIFIFQNFVIADPVSTTADNEDMGGYLTDFVTILETPDFNWNCITFVYRRILSPQKCEGRLGQVNRPISFFVCPLLFFICSPGGVIGDCVTDTFAATSPGNQGSPVICGFNTGQHS